VLVDALGRDPFSKVDLIVWDGDYYVEVTIVYNYEHVSKDKV